jgi:hypothetical protein
LKIEAIKLADVVPDGTKYRRTNKIDERQACEINEDGKSNTQPESSQPEKINDQCFNKKGNGKRSKEQQKRNNTFNIHKKTRKPVKPCGFKNKGQLILYQTAS